jgi:hypothetical protein
MRRKPMRSATAGRPSNSRFKPGQSGNPKGRPKSAKNLKARRRTIYTEEITLNDRKGRRRKVSAILAVDLVLLRNALNGDPRAAQAVLKNAIELGLYEEAGPDAPTIVISAEDAVVL